MLLTENVVTLINQLARANRTILCTIHQPASEVFQLFDRFILPALKPALIYQYVPRFTRSLIWLHLKTSTMVDV